MTPIKQMLLAEAGAGKSHYAATSFFSKHRNEGRILYLDNHYSTATFGLPKASPPDWSGLINIAYDKPEDVRKWATHIRRQGQAGNPYFAVILDDLSEHELTSMDELEKVNKGRDGRQNWGEHLTELCSSIRLLEPQVTGAHLLVVARPDRVPDPLAERKNNKEGVDDRPTVLRPMLRGKFGRYVLHFFDLITWQQKIVKNGEEEFRMYYKQVGDIYTKNRWSHAFPAYLADPSFDKTWATILKAKPVFDFTEGGKSKIEAEIKMKEGE